MHYLYGMLIATAAIIAAEIVFDYSLGDLLKDKALALLHGAENASKRAIQRLSARAARIESKLRSL